MLRRNWGLLVLILVVSSMVCLVSPANISFAEKRIRVGIVYDIGGKGDKSFNDSAYRGIQWAVRDELPIDYVEIEPGADADREAGLRILAEQGFDLIIGVGFLFTDAIITVANEFPDIKFAIVDGFIPDIPNVVSLLFREEQGSFLVGMIAGMKTETKKVGFVGGMDVPLIHKFEAGYIAGVKYACPDCEILSNYAGDTPQAFADPVKGKELALAQYDKGVDVVYHASGLTGAGVFEAAIEKRKYVIGVDSNQNYMGYNKATGENYGLTSMLKQVDVSVYGTIKATVNEEFQGGIRRFSLADNGIGYAVDEYNQDLLTPEMLEKVEEAKQKIIAGEIKVPEE